MTLVNTLWDSYDGKRRIRVLAETARHVLVVRCDEAGEIEVDAPRRRVMRTSTAVCGYRPAASGGREAL